MMATKGDAISLRGLKREELDKLSRLAAEKNMSREAYLRNLVRIHLMEPELRETEDRYEILVQQMLDGVQKNKEKLDELLQRLGVDEW